MVRPRRGYCHGSRGWRPGDKWHLDKVFIRIQGVKQYLWRAVDQDGVVLDILVQARRDGKAAKRFFKRLLKGLQHVPRVISTDKLRSYGVAQQAALVQVGQTLPPLQKQLEETRDLIRALVGDLPNQDVAQTFTLSMLHLPEDLPLSLPSKIVEQRPDVRAAEEQLRSASANVGVAVAAMLPQIILTPNIGTAANGIAAMFGGGTYFWSLVGGATQTIFDSGALLHKRRAADEALIQAAA
jgi:DDE domain/Outer membrane efflux protein